MTTKARQPKGIPVGGQFAAITHSELTLELASDESRHQTYLAESERPLTVQDIEGLQRAHGTSDPGPAYHQHMHKVFGAALEMAAATPEGRVVMAQRAQAEELQTITGTPAREILNFHDEVGPHETGTKPWRNLIRTWSEIWNVPIGNTTFIDTKMRSATGEPTRAELAATYRRAAARIGALDVSTAAKALQKRFPSGHGVVGHLRGDRVSLGNSLEAQEVWITGADGNSIWRGPRTKVPQLGSLVLIPDPHHSEESPLRTSRIPHINGRAWHHYSLDKMAALTAEDLTEEQ